jgi:hypothetical protein
MSKIRLTGSNSGYVEIASAADAGNLTFVLPTSGTSLLGNGNNVHTGITTHQNDFKLEGGSYDVLWDASDNQLEFDDNAILSFGGSSDLQLYHTGNHSIIKNGTGNLILQDDNNIVLEKLDGTNMLVAAGGGSVDLYFNGNKKIETSASGAIVTGIMTATEINYTGSQNLSNRNILINGAMQVAQRGTSSTTSGYQTVDRWRPHWSGVDESPTQAQVTLTSAAGPYQEGHRKALKVTNGNQTTTPAADDYIIIETKIEAQKMASCGWKYTDPSSFITFSFWVKSSVAQNFYGIIRSIDGTSQAYPFETGSLTANTWTKVVKVIPGNSNIQFDNNHNHGLNIRISPYRGTSATGSVTLHQWGAFDTTVQYPDVPTDWYTTNDAEFFMTGCQLEVGSVATPYEHRSFQDELLACQRYYCKSYEYGTEPGSNTLASSRWGRNLDTSDRNTFPANNCTFPVSMRVTPTLTYYTKTGTSGSWSTGGTTPDNSSGTTTITQNYGTLTRVGFFMIKTSPNVSASHCYGGHFTADAEM